MKTNFITWLKNFKEAWPPIIVWIIMQIAVILKWQTFIDYPVVGLVFELVVTGGAAAVIVDRYHEFLKEGGKGGAKN